jgi:asparagine synthetase B (glutamine-hydrolysing)
MCKITDFVGHKRVPDARATVERMTATLAHHGPDGQGARSQHLSDHPLAASLGKSMKDFTKGALGVGRRPKQFWAWHKQPCVSRSRGREMIEVSLVGRIE